MGGDVSDDGGGVAWFGAAEVDGPVEDAAEQVEHASGAVVLEHHSDQGSQGLVAVVEEGVVDLVIEVEFDLAFLFGLGEFLVTEFGGFMRWVGGPHSR